MKVSRKGFLRLDLAAGAGFSLLLGATVCSGDGEEVTGRLLASCRLFGGQEFATREGVDGANLAKIAGYASARANEPFKGHETYDSTLGTPRSNDRSLSCADRPLA